MKRQSKAGAKSLDVAALRNLLSKMPLTTVLGVVRKFPGESSHFEIITEDGLHEVLVDVELMPNGEKVFCRLGFGNDGIYRIPRVDSEVAVIVPMDPQSLIKDGLDFDPIIVAVLDTNAPNELNDDDIVVIDSARVLVVASTVEVKCSDITLGNDVNPLDGVVTGTGIDPFTGVAYAALGNASQKVKAEK